MKKPPPPPRRMQIPIELAEMDEAKTEYMRITKLLGDKLDERDHNLLLDYCMTHGEVCELRAQVDIEGKTLQGPKGGMYINPILNVMISRQSHLASLRRDLYFTPKSRIEKQNRATMSKTKGMRANLEGDDGTND